MSNRALAAEFTVDFCLSCASFGGGLEDSQTAENQVLLPRATYMEGPLLLLGFLILRGVMEYTMQQLRSDS